MQRRSFLSGLAASTLSLPTWAISGPSLGITLPLTGVQAEVAKELEIGYKLATAEMGVGLRVLDDQSVPANVEKNVRELAADPSVLALSGIVGTPHAEAGLAVASAAKLPVVGIRSGAQHLRTKFPEVFHLRASYEDEIDKMVDYCRGAGVTKMAILFSEDSFGTTSRDHLIRRLNESNIEVASSIGVDRNGANIEAASKKTVDAMAGGFGAIALLLIVKPMALAAHELRVKHKMTLPILAMSFTITKNIASSKDEALSGLGLVSAFPLPRSGIGFRQQFRQALAEKNLQNLQESVTAYEGYFYGTVASKAILAANGQRMGIAKSLTSSVLTVGDARIDFTGGKVGYRYLELLRKGNDGFLRA